MNLREQRYVTAIGRHGSIKKAAKELCISSPTLSIFLANLEKDMGVKLFDRLGKKFVPTYAGETYIKYAQKMTALDEEFMNAFGDIREGKTGTLKVGMHPRRTMYLLPEVLGEFAPFHPGVAVELHETDSEEMLDMVLSGDLDLAIDTIRKDVPALEYIPLYSDRVIAVVSPYHENADRGKILDDNVPWIDLKLFDGETFILQKSFQASRKYVDIAINYSAVSPGRIFIVENMETASQLAAEGLGIAFNVVSYTRSYAYHKPVRYFSVGDPDMRLPYFIIRRRDRYMPSYMSDFMSILDKAARKMDLRPDFPWRSID